MSIREDDKTTLIRHIRYAHPYLLGCAYTVDDHRRCFTGDDAIGFLARTHPLPTNGLEASPSSS